jgi:DNA-binding transcriptional LysR family regulator
MDLNLNHLRLLRAVADTGSVTAAAQRLMISQPAVSKQLSVFESTLGVPLLERLPRGVRLTHAGAILADYARRIASLQDQALTAIRDLRTGSLGTLRVGASTTIAVYLLPDLIVTFRRQHPGVQFHLTVANSAAVARAVAEGDLDLGLTEVHHPDPAVDSQVFRHDELVPIAAPSHALARKRSITPAQLCALPFVVRDTGSDTKSFVERALAARGLAITPAMSVGSTEAVKRAVSAGLGVAIVSRLSTDLEIQTHRLKILRVPALNLRRPLHLLTRRSLPHTSIFRAFQSLLAAPGAR